jgi:hypothetical protein
MVIVGCMIIMCLEARTLALDLHPITAERNHNTLMAPAIILAPSAPSLLFEILRLVTSLSEELSIVCVRRVVLLPVIEGARGARGGGKGGASAEGGKRGKGRESVNIKRNIQRSDDMKKRGAMHCI